MNINNAINANDHTPHYLIRGLSIYKTILATVACGVLSLARHKHSDTANSLCLCLSSRVCSAIERETISTAAPLTSSNLPGGTPL